MDQVSKDIKNEAEARFMQINLYLDFLEGTIADERKNIDKAGKITQE